MGYFRANNGSFYDLMRMREGDLRKPMMATGAYIGQQRHRCGRLQEHLGMARMARFGSRLAALSSWRPSGAFFCGGIGGRRSTGVGGVLVETSFEGLDTLQEGEEVMPHARRGLLPIRSWDTESLRKGARIKQKQGAHDAVSSYLVSLSLSQNAWHGSRKIWHGSRKMSRERVG